MSLYDNSFLFWYITVLAGVFGAVMGSFLNCVAWRISHGESFLKGRSHCPKCGHVLGPPDLFPVLSWVFLRGRCRYCGEKVSVRYPLTELMFAALTVACLLRFDLTVLCLRNWVFLCCLFTLSLVDLDVKEIPNGCLVAALAAYAAAAPFVGLTWRQHLWNLLAGAVFFAAFLAVSLVMDKLLGRESLGGGDIKLYGVVGLYLGLLPTLFSVILACILGLLFAAALRLWKKGGEQIPFGPSIAAAAVVLLFFGEGFVNWYLGLLLS